MAAPAPELISLTSATETLPTEVVATRKKRRWRGQLGLAIPVIWITLVTLGALLAPWLNKVPGIRLLKYDKIVAKKGLTPSAKHWLGTDEIGRSILSRLIWGGRVALAVGIVSVLVALIVGGFIGLIAGYYRGKIELVLMTLASTILSFPALILVLSIVAFLGNNLRNIVAAIAIVAIPAFARQAYAVTLAVSQREYVMAARSLGAKNKRIIIREVLPNVILPLSAYALVITAVAIVAEGGLAFLGASVERPTPSWGTMINDGRKLLVSDPSIWHISMIPVACMFLTVLSLNLIGDRVRGLIDGKESKL